MAGVPENDVKPSNIRRSDLATDLLSHGHYAMFLGSSCCCIVVIYEKKNRMNHVGMDYDITYEEPNINIYKLVLLGSSDVGKSSMVLRYLRDEFLDTTCTTGCAFFSQRVYVQEKTLDFEIWDTAGQERYHSVCHLYYRGASAAMLVYDITSKETFLRAQLWLQELQKYISSEEMVIAFVGNKTDLNSERKVSLEDAQAFAEQERLLFMETSAKTGEGVKEVFEAIASQILIMEHHKQDKARRQVANITIQEAQKPVVIHRCCSFQ
ncbi:PREDICTED: ras-related protein Rab-17 [Nanorana parkeri]|uniref:ras-related protein Rab-17 n=1 Tax=Nanorana parkeri TaxID=125878 RepID=UPI0008540F92|nr:PREDICTED: ras-related protein Rab-17 [Nanorana parkeri]